MIDTPPVHVQEITPERDKIIGADKPKKLDLGGRHSLDAAIAEENIGAIMKHVRKRQRRVFELTWEGNKVPRGAEIFGKKIAWTQHGRVITEDGEDIGSYERIEEFGGPNKKSQKMHVYVTSPKLLGVDGESVQES